MRSLRWCLFCPPRLTLLLNIHDCASKRQDAAAALPPWQGEGRRDARVLLHLLSHRRRGQISQLRLIGAVLKANSSYGLTATLEEGGEKGRDAEWGRETRNAALFMKRAHIFRIERGASSDHTASVTGDVRATRREQDASMRAIIPARLMEDGAHLLGLRNWRLVPLLDWDALHLKLAPHGVVFLV